MKKLILLFTIICYTLPSYGLWYRDHVRQGADIFMIDILYPYWAESSYYACWNIDMYPNGGYFYGGIAANMPEGETEETYRPNSVWTFWEHAAYNKRQARSVYIHPSVYSSQYGGEGSSGAAHGTELDWVKPKNWYTMTLRTWGSDSIKNECFIGWWMKDKTNNEWIHYGSFRIPYAATGIRGNSGFLEDFGFGGRNQREIIRGSGFSRKNNEWFPADSITINVPKDGVNGDYWMVFPKDEGKTLSLKHSNNSKYPRNLDPGKKYQFKINQQQKPTLDELVFEGKATIKGKKLIVDWELGKHSSPQLGYSIEVFDNEECQGEAIATFGEEVPQIRTKALNLPKSKRYGVRLKLHDIFDQERSIIISTFSKGELISGKGKESQQNKGLIYNYYEKDSDWNSLKELKTIQPIRSGISNGFDISVIGERNSKFGLTFNGFLNVPETGAYTFVLKSCDGSRLSLVGDLIIDNDGIHSNAERRVSVFLKKGYTPIEVAYFKNSPKKSSMNLSLDWESDRFELRPLSKSDLSYVCEDEIPAVTLNVIDRNNEKYLQGVLTNSEINNVVFYNGKKELGKVTDAPYELRVFPFSGDNRFWCRVTYDKNHTVDSEKTTLTDSSSYSTEWKYKNLGEAGLAHKMSYNNGQFDFVGEGEYQVYKIIKGDFELTGRVVAFTDAPNMGTHWIGLIAKQSLAPITGSDVGIYQTASNGLRSTANYDDLATTRMSFFSMNRSHRWLKVVRKGMRFTTYSSADGKNWQAGLQRQLKADKELYVGITYISTPEASNKVFSGSIADVDLRLTDDENVEECEIQPQEESVDLTITGYSLLDTASTNVAVRYDNGLDLLLGDGKGGYSQKQIKLPNGISKVRSIVQTRGNLLIAASGSSKSGIYLSEDMGNSWKLVHGDFPIAYRNYICGEILAVNPDNPDEITAGSEKAGLFISRDGGKTWIAEDGMEGVSITEVIYNAHYTKSRGIISYNEDNNLGEIWISHDGAKFKTTIGVPNIKFTGIHFGRMLGVLYISSTKGLYTTYNNGTVLNHLVYEIPSGKAYFAMDWTIAKFSYFFSERHFVIPSSGTTLYRSERYQVLWKSMNEELNFGSVYAIKTNPSDNNYVRVFARKGVFESGDSGKSWKPILVLHEK